MVSGCSHRMLNAWGKGEGGDYGDGDGEEGGREGECSMPDVGFQCGEVSQVAEQLGNILVSGTAAAGRAGTLRPMRGRGALKKARTAARQYFNLQACLCPCTPHTCTARPAHLLDWPWPPLRVGSRETRPLRTPPHLTCLLAVVAPSSSRSVRIMPGDTVCSLTRVPASSCRSVAVRCVMPALVAP